MVHLAALCALLQPSADLLQSPSVILQVFFIRDGMKFPDMVHCLKPNPKNHIQEGWRIADFFSHHPESLHMVRTAVGRWSSAWGGDQLQRVDSCTPCGWSIVS